MSDLHQTQSAQHTDALIIGTGFAGIRALIEIKKLGLSAVALEAGTDVGGTWYWNRYPGARTDSQSWTYCFPFPEIEQKWNWEERYPGQAEVHGYLSFVTDHFNLRPLIQFGQRVAAASYDEQSNLWTITTDDGSQFTCKYFIPAVGPLSIPQEPKFKGMEQFKGEVYNTGRWPREPVDFTGKRVAVIGTGASGIQSIPLIAEVAEHVTVFQRTPNFVMPAQNFALDDEFRANIKADYPAVWDKARSHVFGFPLDQAGRNYDDVTDEAERDRIFEEGWQKGGFHFVFETFDDIIFDQRSNDAAADFIRRKIKATVKDPKVAELLTPYDHPYVAKRPPSGTNYYETFNRDNVTLVDIKSDPIESMTETGLRTGENEYSFDALVLATGFDAVTGALARIDITGRDGVRLTDVWAHGAETYLSIGVPNFPNMLMLFGPQCSYANAPVVIEPLVGWLSRVIQHMDENGYASIECTEEATAGWSAAVDEIFNQTLLPAGESANSWYLGANIPGKPRRVLFYFGGVNNFAVQLKECADHDFDGFVFARQPVGANR
jgi:cation diffusion facilitator CzcD-associated flavoprotein CzcO